MEKFHIADVPKTDRITHLVDNLYAKMPVIESARAKLITESYKATEDEPIITRRAKAFAHILHNIPIIIRDEELIVGSSTLAPRGCQTFPEYSFQWLEDELDTVATRTADPFYIAEETKAELREVHKYWKGKTTSELATSYMAPEAILAIDHNIFTPGNYFYNGVGHVTVKYEEVLAIGYEGIIAKAQKELDECNVDIEKMQRYAEKAIVAGNDNDARQFLEKKQQLVSKQAALQQAYDLAHGNAVKMKEMHDKLVSDMGELQSRRDAIRAKVAVAKTQERLNKVGSSVAGVSNNLSAFDRMEEKANRMLDEANAMSELNTTKDDVADLAAKYDEDSSNTGVDDELAALKARLGK